MKANVPTTLGYLDAAGEFKVRAATDEEIVAAQAAAAKIRTGLPHFAQLREWEIQAVIAAYHEDYFRGRLGDAEAEYGEDSAEAAAARRDVAVCLRSQARHAEAFALVPEDPKFQAGMAAIHRPDDEFCACVADEYTRTGIRMHKLLYSATQVGSAEHGGSATLWRCTKCGHLNISNSIPPQDLKIRERMASAGPNTPDDVLFRV